MMHQPVRPQLLLLAAAIATATTLGIAGCGKDKPAASQVAARVNDDEISVHQINAVLAKLSPIPPEMADKARGEVLDKLIDQQVAVQQAVEKKLDRSPEVVTAIEAAKREILARAYLEQVAAAQTKPGADEAKKYYADHPQLFGQRRVYQLQEIMLPAQGAPVDKLREMSGSKSMEQIAEWLKQQNVRFQANAVVRPAEQVSMDLLPKLHEMKDGQIAVFAAPQAISVVRIAASQSVPVDEATAVPQIQRYLANQRANEAVAADMKQLKSKAKIEYVGDFAKTAAAPTPAAAPPVPPAAPAPAAAAPAAPAADGLSKQSLDKGVAGLK
jgi:EpsD family peptidyl-prolyl cis-trans isomerase